MNGTLFIRQRERTLLRRRKTKYTIVKDSYKIRKNITHLFDFVSSARQLYLTTFFVNYNFDGILKRFY